MDIAYPVGRHPACFRLTFQAAYLHDFVVTTFWTPRACALKVSMTEAPLRVLLLD